MAIFAAHTKAMSAQSLPPMPHYSGEGQRSGEDGFDRWIERFEEHTKLAGWSEEHCRYHLKIQVSLPDIQVAPREKG